MCIITFTNLKWEENTISNTLGYNKRYLFPCQTVSNIYNNNSRLHLTAIFSGISETSKKMTRAKNNVT